MMEAAASVAAGPAELVDSTGWEEANTGEVKAAGEEVNAGPATREADSAHVEANRWFAGVGTVKE